MPRISAASLGVVPSYAVELPPPAHLNEGEKAVFRDIVAAADSGHFRSEDRELLGLYCVHVVEARRMAGRNRRSPEHLRELRETTKLLMSLSVKLRLGPKSRAPDHRRAASAGSRSPPSYYDLHPVAGAEDPRS
jgi:phage terminase small subunit